MANLIDASFFVAEISIPNNTATEVAQNINWFINKYEPKVLEQLLGYELSKLLVASPIDVRFANLINGVEYTDDSGVLTKWRGLKQSATESMLAYYIYYQWQRFNAIKQSGLATIIPKGQEMVNTSPAPKMVQAYNNFVDGVWCCNRY